MILSDLPVTIVLVVSVVLLTASLTVAIVVALSRRRQKEAQSIVLILEQMRSGRVRTRLDLDARSPFASIAESANRLGQDLGVRWSRAETATEGFYALQEAARGYVVIATDADGDLRTLSPGAGQLFGWEEDAVVGRNASLLFDPASWKDLLPKLARKSLRERGVETRALMARHDGTQFHARLVVRVRLRSAVSHLEHHYLVKIARPFADPRVVVGVELLLLVFALVLVEPHLLLAFDFYVTVEREGENAARDRELADARRLNNCELKVLTARVLVGALVLSREPRGVRCLPLWVRDDGQRVGELCEEPARLAHRHDARRARRVHVTFQRFGVQMIAVLDEEPL